jgi:hypothetical protein
LPKPRPGNVVVIGLLLLMLLSSSDAVALTLPNPPDRSATANNQNGPSLPSPNGQSFPGGVLLVKDGSSSQVASTKEFVAEFACRGGSRTVTKQAKTEIGESLSGPISNDQTAGIVAAIDSVRPSKTVSLSTEVIGGGYWDIIYTLTGIIYNVTTYSVWTTTQPSPTAEQRVGYIVVGVPVQLQIVNAKPDSGGAICTSSWNKFGAGFTPDPLAWLYQPLIPDDGVAPIITYGTVRVLSGGDVAGAASIRPGENATFLLPPGTYSAVADVVLFGIPFGVSSGTYSSPQGAVAAQFTVSLTSAEYIWYGLEILGVIILIAVIWVIAKRLHLWAVVLQAFERVSRALARDTANS